MATNKRKQDEKHLKLLREMVALAHNKQCFDCNQRGPTYLNMTIGAFICTSCSGLLRGLNPPHRVKSMSMASFSPEEIEFIKSRGNDFCRKVWLALYDTRSHIEPDTKDENKIKDFMAQKYEKKRWYRAPTDELFEEARKLNEPSKAPDIKKTFGSNIKPIVLNNRHDASKTQPAVVPPPVNVPQQTQPPKQQKSAAVNLLDDLGGDPFASPNTNNSQQGTGFADFANFGNPGGTTNTFQQPQQVDFLTSSAGTGVQQSSSGFAAFSTTPAAATAPQTSAPSAGDRYAALADFFSTDTNPQPPANVSWDVPASQGGGAINWGRGGSSSTSSGFGSATTLSSSSSAFNGQTGSTAANPFGTSTATSFSQPASGMNTMPGTANPFMSSDAVGPGVPPPPYSTHHTAPSFGQFPPQNSMAQPGAMNSTPGFNMQNGTSQWAVTAQNNAGMNFGIAPGKTAQPAFGGSWGAPSQQPQSTVNPFMNISSHPQPAVRNTTNPFLQ